VQFDVTVSTLRDRVCMTAAMLVLEPIFEADLPSARINPEKGDENSETLYGDSEVKS
jgi:hypothetical protein